MYIACVLLKELPRAQIKIFLMACLHHQGAKRPLWGSYLWDVIVVIVITFVICNGGWVGVCPEVMKFS